MFNTLVETFKKSFKLIYNMFNQDNLATAHIAQIFGSELLKVQNSAQTDSGQQPNIVNLNPKQFLMGEVQYTSSRKIEEQRLIESLQREAEASHPLPNNQYTAPFPQELQPIKLIPEGGSTPSKDYIGNTSPVWERIANSLERIANAVDKVDFKTKKKTVKRKSKSSKPNLLNEINA